MVTKALAEARARVARLEAAIKAAADDEAAREKAVLPAKARYDRLAKRQSKMLMLTTAAGNPNSRGGAVEFLTVTDIGIGWHSGELGKVPAVTKALMSGDLKVQRRSSSVAYTLGGMLQRTRFPAGPETVKAINAVVKRRRAAEAALERAWAAEKEVRDAAFESGIKVEKEPIAAEVAARLVADKGTRTDRDHELQQAAREAEWALPDARIHLDWVKATNPDKDVCPCKACQEDRAAAIRIRDKNRELDALPTAMFLCAGHEPPQRHRGPINRIEVEITNQIRAGLVKQDERLDALLPRESAGWPRFQTIEVPVAWCRKGSKPVAYARIPELVAELQKAAKVAAREAANKAKVDEAARKAAEKARAKFRPVTPTVTEGDLDWICPSCYQQQPLVIEGADDDDYGPYVMCFACGHESDPDVVKTVAKAA